MFLAHSLNQPGTSPKTRPTPATSSHDMCSVKCRVAAMKGSSAPPPCSMPTRVPAPLRSLEWTSSFIHSPLCLSCCLLLALPRSSRRQSARAPWLSGPSSRPPWKPLLRASSALATSPITSLSSQRTRRTPPRPLLAAVARGHRCRGRRKCLCARPGQPSPPRA